MRKALIILAVGLAILSGAVWVLQSPKTAPVSDAIAVPSGQVVTFLDQRTESDPERGLTARYRFVAPEISDAAGGIDFETAATDMEMLCNQFVLPKTAAQSPQPGFVIVSLSSEAVEFGVTMPNIKQYFELYRVSDGTCSWEGNG